MSNNQIIGKRGEDKAAQFLENQGYTIIERNWRFKKAEIDIIAKIEQMLVFVEVKSKSYTYFGQPEESVSEKKEKLILDAANAYMLEIGHDWEIRFDIIAIVFNEDQSFELNHYKDAFFPSI